MATGSGTLLFMHYIHGDVLYLCREGLEPSVCLFSKKGSPSVHPLYCVDVAGRLLLSPPLIQDAGPVVRSSIMAGLGPHSYQALSSLLNEPAELLTAI